MYVWGGLCLSFFCRRWSECTFGADFVLAALVEGGVSVHLGLTLFKLNWWKME